jgi:SAM-dependent methyltransferase
MADKSVSGFYDALADDYHLIHTDWDESLRWQGTLLDRLISAKLGPGPHGIYDCTSGIGTQALGLAALGHRVHASDISPGEVARLKREAKARNLAVGSEVADILELEEMAEGPFDVVLACDNSLAHMLDDDALDRAVANMATRTRPGGLVLTSIRDYDALGETRPQFAPPSTLDIPNSRRIMLQFWDWRDEGRVYGMTLFILHRADGDWKMTHSETALRAVRRDELTAAFDRAGLESIEWHMPGDDGFYQPLITARKPE